ncbi:MAG: WYL domain-containing protein [Actinomycetaceae bacterium]|nr:WYL domain-containing protein [Actinomycetaceae bacterium]
MGPNFKTPQRLLSLLLALSNRELGLTKAEIKQHVPNYQTANEASSDRMFERDKEVLANAGIEIVVKKGYEGELRYVLQRPKERRIVRLQDYQRLFLQAAASLWEDEKDPLFHLKVRSAVHQTKTDMPRIELVGSHNIATLIRAQTAGRAVRFTYMKPGEKPEKRHVDPLRIFLELGNLYVTGFDHERQDLRTFRLTRIAGDIEMMAETTEHDNQAKAGTREIMPVMAVRNTGGRLVKIASHTYEHPLPSHLPADEWHVVRGKPAPYREWLDRIIIELTDTVVLGPEELRRDVIERLRASARRGEERDDA